MIEPPLSGLLGHARVVVDATGELVLAGVHQDMPDHQAVAGQAVEDLLEVVAAKYGHRGDQDASDVAMDLGGGLDDELAPWRPVLEVVDRFGEDVTEQVADVSGS